MVEVPIVVNGMGLHPTYFGPLPAQLAALDAAHMYVHELMVEAVLSRDRRAALHARTEATSGRRPFMPCRRLCAPTSTRAPISLDTWPASQTGR